jgi:RNA polymerase sigma-70 factor (ECF subfamily)
LEPQRSSVTEILSQWRAGDNSAFDRLFPIVYEEMRALAAKYLASERPGHTLQPTALVHEVYLRLAAADLPWEDRAHFFAVAARTMRRILVDHARERGAAKRGGDWVRTTLEEGLTVSGPAPMELTQLDQAMTDLTVQDERAARAAELHWFGGLSYEDTARTIGVSPATVHRDLRMARAWICRALDAG